MNKNVIQVEQLSKSFGKQQVLKKITLHIPQGKIIGLLGPSGAGKSTIIKLILGMEKADTGTIKIYDKTMPNRKLLEKIGYMAQSDALYKQLKGYENLKFFAAMKGIKSKKQDTEIKRVAKVVGLENQLDKYVKNYSGGMMRRLSLAISLLDKPELLILDEPTVGIDPVLSHQIWQELRIMRDNGTTILITTHIMAEAELTNRVALLRNGKIIADDSPANLKTQYHADSIEQVFMKAEEN